MNKNVGKTDRIIRIVLGTLLIGAGFYFNTWWGLVGLIPILTASLGWCPLYLPFGLSTCATKQQKA